MLESGASAREIQGHASGSQLTNKNEKFTKNKYGIYPDKKLSYRRQTARQLRMSLKAGVAA